MYAAFWLNPASKDPNKRVVFCQPFCKKPTMAWAILRSAIHEKATGGILSGTDEELKRLIEQVDQKDQKWPNDADRMVAQITQMAQRAGLSVVFRQNLDPDGTAKELQEIQSGLILGTPVVEQETDRRMVVRVPVTAKGVDIATALDRAEQFGWSATADTSVYHKFGQTTVALYRYRSVASRGALEFSYHVNATPSLSKTNAAGHSEEFKLGFNQLDELLDTMLGSTAQTKRYKFVLLIKERNNSIVFLGTKSANTLRHAVEQYVAHLTDNPASDEPRSSQPDSEDEDHLTNITPPLHNCRFWKL